MKFPNLNSNQFAVIMADSHTGIILNINQQFYYNNSNDNVYSVFENIESAKSYIENVALENEKIEFIIYNYKQELIEIIKANA